MIRDRIKRCCRRSAAFVLLGLAALGRSFCPADSGSNTGVLDAGGLRSALVIPVDIDIDLLDFDPSISCKRVSSEASFESRTSTGTGEAIDISWTGEEIVSCTSGEDTVSFVAGEGSQE